MSGQLQWIRGTDGKMHPDNSMLLAYTRQQTLGSSWLIIHEHIADCELCEVRCQEFSITSQAISDTLAAFDRRQHYAPVAERVLEYIQHPAAADLAYRKRQQARWREDLAIGRALLMMPLAMVLMHLANLLKMLNLAPRRPRNNAIAAVPITSIPALAFLVALGVVIALAYSISTLPNIHRFSPFEITSTATSQSRYTVVPNPTPTPKVEATKNAGSGPTTGPATPITPKPTIALCMTPADKNMWRIRFCGSNFAPGARVELFVEIGSNAPHARHQVIVDAHGSFQDDWFINNCKEVPVAVYAQDVAHVAIVSPVLRNIQFEKCAIQYPPK